MRRWILVAAVAWPVLVAGSADAQSVAFVRDGKVYETALGAAPRLVDGTGRAVDIAYASDGTLYVSRPEAGTQGCVLYRAGDATPIVGFSQLAGQLNTATGLCTIERDPRGGLYVEADDDTLGSEQVFRLDSTGGTVIRAARGAEPAASPNGRRLLVVQQRFFTEGGSFETLALGTPGRLGSFRRIVPRPRSESVGASWAAPAFAPSGNRISAVRQPFASAPDPRNQLVVGPPGGRLRPVWRAGPQQEIVQTAWLSPDTVLAVVAGRAASRARVTAVDLETRRSRVVLRGVSTIAVR